MHVLSAKLDEVGVDSLTCLRDTCYLSLVEEFIIDLRAVFREEEVRDFTRVEQVVDIFEE